MLPTAKATAVWMSWLFPRRRQRQHPHRHPHRHQHPHRHPHQGRSRRRSRALIIISIAKLGPPMESARQTPATCWKIVVRAAVSAQSHLRSLPQHPRLHPHRRQRQHPLRHPHRLPHKGRSRPRSRALMIISIANFGPPMENAKPTPITCLKIVVKAAVSALDQAHLRSQLRHPPPHQRRRHRLHSLRQHLEHQSAATTTGAILAMNRVLGAVAARVSVKDSAVGLGVRLQAYPGQRSQQCGHIRKSLCRRRSEIAATQLRCGAEDRTFGPF